jgi:hypothetical protein
VTLLRSLAIVLVAVVAALLLTRPGDDDALAAADPVAVSSDAPRLGSLEQLVAAADLVVRAEVAATERGRVFGEPGGAAIESRLVTLDVTEVLAGIEPRDDTVLVEEEGWLEDGTPVIVDGAAPSRGGDDGIWFLVDVGDPDTPVYVVVSAQGRYLADGDRLVGATGDDPLIEALAHLSVDELAGRIVALRRSSP